MKLGIGRWVAYFNRSRKFDRFCLNRLVIRARVALRLGILTQQVARAAISIIFLNDGWLKACIGCKKTIIREGIIVMDV